MYIHYHIVTMNYKNGKIYKLVNMIDDEIYIGSTCSSLHKRLYKHKANAPSQPQVKVFGHMNDVGFENVKIILVENYPCDNKMELLARERHWFDIMKPTLNSNRPYVTKNECNHYHKEYKKKYNEANKDKLREQGKKYYTDNKDKIREKRRKYYADNKDKKKEYCADNKDKIRERKRKYYEDNKEMLRDKARHIYTMKKKSNLNDIDGQPTKTDNSTETSTTIN